MALNQGAIQKTRVAKHNAYKAKPANSGPEIIIKCSPLDWIRLAQQTPPPRQWFIEHWLGPTSVLFAGRGGIGKSLLAQQIATAAVFGKPFLDHIPQPLKVLMWACEDDHDELWRRQIDICRLMGVSLSDLSGRLIIEPRLGKENTLYALQYGTPALTPLFAELEAQVNDYEANVLILDNSGQVYGANENDKHHVTQFFNFLHGMYRGRLGANIVIGHPSKALASEFSGNAAWENAVRMRWFLSDRLPDEEQDEGPPKDVARVLAKRKTNYSGKDYRRFTYSNGVLVPEDIEIDAAPGMVEALRKTRAQSTVLAAVPALNAKNLWTSHASASRDR